MDMDEQGGEKLTGWLRADRDRGELTGRKKIYRMERLNRMTENR